MLEKLQREERFREENEDRRLRREQDADDRKAKREADAFEAKVQLQLLMDKAASDDATRKQELKLKETELEIRKMEVENQRTNARIAENAVNSNQIK